LAQDFILWYTSIMLNQMESSEMNTADSLKVDRTAFSIATLSEETDEKAYWLSKTPYERLEALEWMRQVIYGYSPSTTRLQRILTIAQFPSS
jgi:hypothetical protein